jgi:hypothetical protein
MMRNFAKRLCLVWGASRTEEPIARVPYFEKSDLSIENQDILKNHLHKLAQARVNSPNATIHDYANWLSSRSASSHVHLMGGRTTSCSVTTSA